MRSLWLGWFYPRFVRLHWRLGAPADVTLGILANRSGGGRLFDYPVTTLGTLPANEKPHSADE
jgi:hypothetical protein